VLPADVCVCVFFCFLNCYHAFFTVFDWVVSALCLGIVVATMLQWLRSRKLAKQDLKGL
jgi:hypothetical protein